MNTLSSSEFDRGPDPVTTLEYQDVGRPAPAAGSQPKRNQTGDEHRLSMSEEELRQRLVQAQTSATEDLEQRLLREYQAKLAAERARIGEVIREFEDERSEYYSKVEPELVHLALAVAAKILHREANVDRMLLAGLAKVAVENLQERSHVSIRIAPAAAETWREYFAAHLRGTDVKILEDSQLQGNDCILETELGTADISLDAQLKEIERGFFDLLAKRPEPK